MPASPFHQGIPKSQAKRTLANARQTWEQSSWAAQGVRVMFSLWAGCEGSDCGIRCEYPHHSPHRTSQKPLHPTAAAFCCSADFQIHQERLCAAGPRFLKSGQPSTARMRPRIAVYPGQLHGAPEALWCQASKLKEGRGLGCKDSDSKGLATGSSCEGPRDLKVPDLEQPRKSFFVGHMAF